MMLAARATSTMLISLYISDGADWPAAPICACTGQATSSFTMMSDDASIGQRELRGYHQAATTISARHRAR